MKKLTRLMALVLLAVFMCTTVAFAEDELRFAAYQAFDDGYMHVLLMTNHAEEENLNFTVTADGYPVKVENAYAMRTKGTSWYVVLDYGRYINTGGTNHVTKVQDEMLQGISNLVADIDQGALVLVNDQITQQDISMTSAGVLRDNLRKAPNPTVQGGAALLKTLQAVVNHVKNRENEASIDHKLPEKVCIVVVTPGREVDAKTSDQIGALLKENSGYTTHILCAAGSEEKYGADQGGWRDNANKLQEKAAVTAGGVGFITDELTTEEAKDGVQRVSDAERSMVRVELNFQAHGNAGKEIKVTQKLANSRELTMAPFYLSDDVLKIIRAAISSKRSSVSHVSNGALLMTDVNAPVKPKGLGTEAIIAIVLGVIIVALAIVLVLMRTKKKAPKDDKVYAAAAAAPRKTQVIFTGANGTTLRGDLTGGRLTVGRDPARAKLVVNDPKASGLHMTLSVQGDGLLLTDNNSTNGVKVNNVKVNGSTMIRQNDTVAFGSTSYTVTWRRV